MGNAICEHCHHRHVHGQGDGYGGTVYTRVCHSDAKPCQKTDPIYGVVERWLAPVRDCYDKNPDGKCAQFERVSPAKIFYRETGEMLLGSLAITGVIAGIIFLLSRGGG